MTTTADPRGRWFRVYARQVRQHPKFRDLSLLEIGAWTALRAEAELRDGAVFPDRDEALLVLKRRSVARPGPLLDALVRNGLFDLRDDGSIAVHDREEHDRPKYPSDDPEKVKERVARHREAKGNEPGNDPVTSPVTNGNESLARGPAAGAGAGADSASSSEAVTETSRAREPWDEPDAATAYHQVTGRFPSERVMEWLNRLSDDHPEETISAELARQYAAEPNLGTLLSRTENELKLDAHRRAKADERARAKAQAAIEKPHREKEREATPEEREQAKLWQQAIRIGLKLGLEVPKDLEEVRKFVMRHGSAA